ncbi:MAG: PAS domain S-box protein [Methylibium sp.]|nr:cache domain-containing protein [Methylibium sp.]MBA3599476.1 PAS domain S-box protein [Methylibium sp.]
MNGPADPHGRVSPGAASAAIGNASLGETPNAVRPRPLRTHLLRMTLGTVLPMLALVVALSWLLVNRERATFERGARDRVQALASAVDAELRISVESLRVLADDGSLLSDDLAEFHAHLVRTTASREPWSNINLALPSGERVVDALVPFGSPIAPIRERKSFDAALRTGQPQIGTLVQGGYTRSSVFSVRLPVMADGKLRYVLTAVVSVHPMQRLLAAQGMPPDWTGAILDADKTIVARTIDPEKHVGQPASRNLREGLTGADQGFVRGTTRDGRSVYTPFYRSAFSGWTVATGIPVADVHVGAWRALGFASAGAALALALALLLARVFGRGIARPFAELAAQARRLARGGPLSTRPRTPMRITEAGDLEQALHDAADAVHARDDVRRRLAALTDNATGALFMMNGRQHCVFMNPAAERMTGYTLAEVQGRVLHDLIHHTHSGGSPYPIEDCAIDRAFPENDRQQGEDVFVHRSGRFYPVAYTASPIREHGTAVGTVVEVRDITEERAARAERLRLLEGEQRARAESDAANRAKDEFLAMLGHELRNPLGAISNAAYLLEAKAARGGAAAGAEPSARAFDVIRRQIVHVTRLVDDLLDASRVATGKIALTRRPVELAALTQRTARAVFGDAASARHRLASDLQTTWVEGDETRLEQIVSNLLSNALRYTPAGGNIELSLRAEGGHALLCVRDDGIGMTAELLPRIFGLGHRADAGAAAGRTARRQHRRGQRGAGPRQRLHAPAARHCAAVGRAGAGRRGSFRPARAPHPHRGRQQRRARDAPRPAGRSRPPRQHARRRPERPGRRAGRAARCRPRRSRPARPERPCVGRALARATGGPRRAARRGHRLWSARRPRSQCRRRLRPA